MPKYIPVADKIADGLFAAKNRLFDFVQKSLDEGKEEKEILKEIKETLTADPAVLSEIEYTFFKKKDKSSSITPVVSTKKISVNPYRTKKAADLIELGKEYDAIMNAATDMHEEGIISDEDYASIRKVYDNFDDPTYLAQSLKELKDTMEKAMATNKVAFDLPYDFYFKVVVSFEGTKAGAIGRVVLDDKEDTASFSIYKDDGKITEKMSIDEFRSLLSDKKIKIITEDEYENELTKLNKSASWIADAKVGDQVELNDEIGKVTFIGDDKIEVQTPTKKETVWKN